MATDSARLHLPFIEPGQAQKEWTHNEALALIDIAVQSSIDGVLGAPPVSPAEGQCWIVGAASTGAWAGRTGAIAGWTTGGWRFVSPREGMTAWHRTEATQVRYRAGNWTLERSAAIVPPTGGAMADTECRAAVAAIVQALQARGLTA